MKAMITGGGIGGLCAAVALHQRGLDVEVYEQSPAARAVGAGLSLWPNAVNALRDLGLGETLGAGQIEAPGAIHRADGTPLSRLDVTQMQRQYGAATVVVHRVDFMHALIDALTAQAGDVIRYGKRLQSYRQNADSITVTFSDGTQTTGDVLIGADGIHSQVRAQMHPLSRPVYRGYAAWRGVTTFPHADVKSMWGETWGKGARFGLLPLSRGRVYWFATSNRPAESPPDDHRAVLEAQVKGWHAPIPALIAATPDDAILYNDIADIAPLSSWVEGRVALLGDAAHAMTPNMGQGACQAIEDAVVLGACIHSHGEPVAALKAYQARRLRHANRVLRRSLDIGRMGQLANPLLVGVRDTLVRLTPAQVAQRQFDFVLAR